MARQQLEKDQIRQRLDSSVTGLDTLRKDSLNKTEQLQVIKNNALKKEQARLQQKYGDGHPRVRKTSNRLEYNKGALPELKAEAKRAEIEIPEFDTSTWMVHGRVLDREQEGIKGLTLSLVDAKGSPQKQLGYACTDERGYYALRYQFEDREKRKATQNPPLYLTVTDAKGNVCHREEQPLFINIGKMDYRLIILDGKQCTPPPGWHEEAESGDLSMNQGGAEWIVEGTVVYDDDKPAANLNVNLVDKESGETLATAKTNHSGNFRQAVPVAEEAAQSKEPVDVNVKITQESGKQLYASRKPLRAKAGESAKRKIKVKRK